MAAALRRRELRVGVSVGVDTLLCEEGLEQFAKLQRRFGVLVEGAP